MLLPVGIHFRVFQACQELLFLMYVGILLLCILGDDNINQIDHKEPICFTIISHNFSVYGWERFLNKSQLNNGLPNAVCCNLAKLF